MRVVFTEPAGNDLEAIGDWIAKDNPLRAASFVRELRDACLEIGPRSTAYQFVEHRRSDGIRRKVYGNYLIFYRVVSDAVEILHVLHGARDYAQILFDNDASD
ncbi:MAG: toxin ParE1/3/4 [Rhodospirillaceae bacterium]|nr:toxin ParE1/3/4 [Rhodospirillaceae bacterium]HEV7547793.1 type II toxin-antitoxin system RelE/ParE family toxin [Reyranella sp.]